MDDLTAIELVPDVIPPQLPEPSAVQVNFADRLARPAPTEPLRRTGTDDDDAATQRETGANLFLLELQRQQIAEMGWTPQEREP